MNTTTRTTPLTTDRRWRAVLARDARRDGDFVYAVRSTGIYCRPSCPSRRPRRAQVAFYPDPREAEAAGFRPCRRCHPDGRAADPRAAWVRQACAELDAATTPVSLPALAQAVGAPAERLRRAFVALLGVTPRAYADARRAERLRHSLRDGRGVSPALYAAGFGSPSRVYGRPLLGMTPATYADGGRGARIAYGVVPCPHGRLLVAATSRGVCRVSLGSEDRALVHDLRHEFPAAELRRDQRALAGPLRHILRRLTGHREPLDLPLDIRATAFQRRVWDALRSIPHGETRSYQEVARAIGRPRATRAVASACAANPVAIIVPCHRVVRSDGGVGGYRWGVARKRAILETERSTHGSRGRQ